MHSLIDSAKEAADQEALLASLRKDFQLISMYPDGDCGFELMCRWRSILACRRDGRRIPRSVIRNPVREEDIITMRQEIANLRQSQVSLHKNEVLHVDIRRSLVDWRRSPQENDGRNREVFDAASLG